ncbi:MAG TPA: IgGFc-binding protein [bacterium]|nr:IgGFc-binding protein [bacterium]
MKIIFFSCIMAVVTFLLGSCTPEEKSEPETIYCGHDTDCPDSTWFCDPLLNECVKKPGFEDSDLPGSDDIASDSSSDETQQPDNDEVGTPCDTVGQARSCYSGPAGTAGYGICKAGTQTCTQQNTWGPCEGETTPTIDNCDDDLDNDCNGIANDGFKEGVPGCVCIPLQAECDGNISKICLANGKELLEYECDPLQGSSCESGMCTGLCSPQALGNASYIGCDYYPTVTSNAYIETEGNAGILHFAAVVSNSTATDATVTVTQGSATILTDTVPASSVKILYLPWTPALNPMSSALIPDQAYRLRTNMPVTVYQFNPLEYVVGNTYSYTNDASLLLPVNVWDKEYIVASRATSIEVDDKWGFYAVIASQDNTTVTVTPSATGGVVLSGGGIADNGTGTVTMNRGSVLQVLSGGPNDGLSVDLTGTKITADKPVQVIGGHNCTYVPYDVGACDHLEESMFPLSTLGLEYLVTAPSINDAATKKAAFVRIISTDAEATALTYDPPNPQWPSSLSGMGNYIELDYQFPFKITADKKILVSQYMKGQSAGGGTGDPAMSLAVPTIQYRKDYLFHAPTNYELNFVDIIAPTSGTVTLDGAPVTGFVPIGTTGFSTTTVLLGPGNEGNHVITGTLGYYIGVYGYGQYTSYWYPGGLDLKKQQ